jgi:3-keto-L-gulonate-6-phosphate decarboxylase
MVAELPDYQLQLALDHTELVQAVAVMNAIEVAGGLLTRVEVGTPLVLSEGYEAVRRVREQVPNGTVVADVKICDAGSKIASAAFAAGADVVTVVAAAIDDQTWDGVISASAGEGPSGPRRVLIDLIGLVGANRVGSSLGGWLQRAQVAGVPVELCVHRPKVAPPDFGRLYAEAETPGHVAGVLVAGSLAVTDVRSAFKAGFDAVIIGGAVSSSDNPGEAWVGFERERDSWQREMYRRVLGASE